MGARTGEDYLRSIRQNQPTVFLNGEQVADVTTYPVFRGPLRTIMEQYDLQHAEANRDVCLFRSPATGEMVSSSFLMPRSREDLVKRRRHFKLRADHHFGLMGRAPDFMNAYVTAWGFAADHYGRYNPVYGRNALAYYEYVRDRDLFLTHTLVNPQIDRSKTSANQEDPYFHLGLVRSTPDGIVVRGAKMLATMAPLCEELLVAPYGGVAPGDDAYALAFAIPTKTPGLRFICRETFSGGDRTHFDHPLSTRFEEMDCIAIFDDVLVPWDRVLVDGSPGSAAIVNGVRPDPRAGVLVQTSARLVASLELFCGVATKLADAVGITGFLHIQEKLGQMLAQLDLVRTAFLASDALASEDAEGYWVPYMSGIGAAHLQAGAIHGQYVDIVQILAGGGFFYAPSDADFKNADLRADIDKFVRGRPGVDAEQRVRLFKLAWDLTGDAFGQRVRHYVRFYSGDPVRNTAGFYIGYDKAPLWDVVDRVFAGPGADVPLSPAEPAPPGPRRTEALTGNYPAASHPVAQRG